MNIFDLYLEKIIKIINTAQSEGLLKLPDKLNGINVDIPPPHFDCDISTNVAMVLSKPNQKSPIEIANQLVQIIKNNDNEIDDISVAKPGFINIKFKPEFWNNFLKNIILDYKNFGIKIWGKNFGVSILLYANIPKNNLFQKITPKIFNPKIFLTPITPKDIFYPKNNPQNI